MKYLDLAFADMQILHQLNLSPFDPILLILPIKYPQTVSYEKVDTLNVTVPTSNILLSTVVQIVPIHYHRDTNINTNNNHLQGLNFYTGQSYYSHGSITHPDRIDNTTSGASSYCRRITLYPHFQEFLTLAASHFLQSQPTHDNDDDNYCNDSQDCKLVDQALHSTENNSHPNLSSSPSCIPVHIYPTITMDTMTCDDSSKNQAFQQWYIQKIYPCDLRDLNTSCSSLLSANNQHSKNQQQQQATNHLNEFSPQQDYPILDVELQFIHCNNHQYHDAFYTHFRNYNASHDNNDNIISDDYNEKDELLNDHTSNNDRLFLLKHLKKNMQGRFLKGQSIIPITLPMLPYYESNNHNDDTEMECIAYFRVSHVNERYTTTMTTNTTNTTNETNCDTTSSFEKRNNDNEHHLCYRLGPCHTFNLTIDANFCHDRNHHQNDDYDNDNSIYNVVKHVDCPGYSTLIDDITSLACLNSKIASPSAILLTGCAGCGKTRLASAAVHQLLRNSSQFQSGNVKFISIKDVILEASTTLDISHLERLIYPPTFSPTAPNIFIIDDLESIFDVAGNSDESEIEHDFDYSSIMNSEKKVTFYALITAIDNIVLNRQSDDTSQNNHLHNYRPQFILGIATTSETSTRIPKSLVRVGRFEKVIQMPAPTEAQRCEILESILKSLPIENNNDTIKKEEVESMWSSILASQTCGCVASDLKGMCVDALTRSKARSVSSHVQDLDTTITWEEMKEAARNCIPSQLALLDVTVSRTFGKSPMKDIEMNPKLRFDMSWVNFGGYTDMKNRLYRTVVRPWQYHLSQKLNGAIQDLEGQILPPSGVLFHGPGGTGKTFAAECLASALGFNVIKVRASNVLDKWLGGSESAIRSLFSRCRLASPAILLFDEIDSLASNREDDSDGTSDVYSRLLSTLLNEIDGVSTNKNKREILVLATTNRIDAIDAALLRPGRLEEHILITYPNAMEIKEIMKIQLEKAPVDDATIEDVSELLEELRASGADIKGICTDACLNCIQVKATEDQLDLNKLTVDAVHFDRAIRLWKRENI